MSFLRSLAYDYSLGGFPLVVLVGFATYALFAATAAMVGFKRSSRRLRRIPVRVHRSLAIAALLLATVHLLMGLSVYVYQGSRAQGACLALDPRLRF